MLVAAASLAAGGASAADWRIVAVDRQATSGSPSLQLSPDGSFAGSTGCNRFRGRARLDAGDLVIDGPLAVTRMACRAEALGAQDDLIIAFFDGRLAFAFDPLRDSLSLSNGRITLALTRAPSGETVPAEPPAPRPRAAGEPSHLAAFGPEGRLDLYGAPSMDAAVLGGVDAGTVLRNDGCAQAGGERWCEVASLDGSLAGWAPASRLEPAGSALRAGQGVFDATGSIPCAKGTGAPMRPCAFAVARDGGGTATVLITKPDGLERALFFVDGAFVSADTSQAGGGFAVSATREGDLNRVRVDDERYELPDAVLFGG